MISSILHDAEITADAQRRTMIDSQLRTVGVIDPAVLAAMGRVPREAFLPPALHGLAYADAALEICPGRWLLEPMVLALLLQNARVGQGDRVLVVGAATGYSAAVLADMGARVTAIEADPTLVAMAGVAVTLAPLAAGWPAAAPYDVILFEGSIEVLPPVLATQLAPGGRVAAVVRTGNIGRAIVGPVLGDGRIAGLPFLEVAARPLPGFAAPRQFDF